MKKIAENGNSTNSNCNENVIDQNLHKKLDTVERSRDGLSSGAGNSSGGEERDIFGNKSENSQRMLQELRWRGLELFELSLFCHRNAGEITTNATASTTTFTSGNTIEAKPRVLEERFAVVRGIKENAT